ncbi:MAG: Rrf2 family transcriptional regulator [Holophagales bacterium]|nr:Rrf2 family transcriptional regulator [Holophagales bacterium]
MQITKHTDYALRLLMYLSVRSERTTIQQAANALGVSRNHLVKITNRLGGLGHIDLVRGRSGGISLSRAPEDISVGSVFRELENCVLVECFDEHATRCVFTGNCVLEEAIRSALEAFCRTLDRVTLADLVQKRTRVQSLVGIQPANPPR